MIPDEIREAARQAAREIVARQFDPRPQHALIPLEVREGRMDDYVAVQHARDVAHAALEAAYPLIVRHIAEMLVAGEELHGIVRAVAEQKGDAPT